MGPWRTGGEPPEKTSESTFSGLLCPQGGSPPRRSLPLATPPRGIGASAEVNSASRRLFSRGRLRRGDGRAARPKPRASPRNPPAAAGFARPSAEREGGPLPSRKGKARLFPRRAWLRRWVPRRKSRGYVEDWNAEVRQSLASGTCGLNQKRARSGNVEQKRGRLEIYKRSSEPPA